jgi:hypothetical protein
MRGVGASVGRQNLSYTEKCGKKSGRLRFNMANAIGEWAAHLFWKQIS